jgi:3,4-dihydroxy 2-butanone 4-phosphate synthase/GTP cyclohydrolase II
MAISNRIENGTNALREGRMLILTDGAQGEADLCMAAERVRPADVNFMVTHARGLVCVSMTKTRLQALGIPLMVPEGASNRHPFGASVTTSSCRDTSSRSWCATVACSCAPR